MKRVARVTSFLAFMVMALAGPVQAAGGQGPFAGYANRYSGFDYKLGWQTVQDPQGVAIQGVLKNLRYGDVDSLTLSVRLLDRDGRLIARDTTFPIPQQMTNNAYRPFSLRLDKASLDKGETLQFLIWSTGSEGGNGGFGWLTGFAVDAASGKVLGPQGGRSPDEW